VDDHRAVACEVDRLHHRARKTAQPSEYAARAQPHLPSSSSMPSTAKALFARYIDEFWNQDQLDVADELYTDDHVYHDPNLPNLSAGPEGVKERGRIYKAALPGRVTEVHDWVVEEDRTLCFWTYRGAHHGPLGEIPPTGREAVIPGMHLCHYRDGRIAESWVMWDRLGFLEQLGLVTVGPQA
jgi:steroid delta-isomerase-like uncharacterized protein